MAWDQQPPPDSDRPSEALDALLADAAWPEVDATRLARLEGQWDRLVHRRTRQRRWTTAAALVGCLAAGVAFSQFRRDVAPPTQGVSPSAAQIAQSQRPRGPAGAPTAHVTPQDSVSTPGQTQPTGNGPAALAAAQADAEKTVLVALDRRMRRRTKGPSPSDRVAVQRAITEVTTSAEPNIDQIADRLRGSHPQLEQELVAVIRQADGPRRAAAVRLLAKTASRRSLPVLIQLLRDPRVRRDAVAVDTAVAIARLADPLTLYRLLQAEPTTEVRKPLLAAMLDNGQQQSVGLFLSLVQDPTTTSDALESLSAVTTPPVDSLLRFFAAPRVSYRRAAALVLGRLPDPAISSALVAMVLRKEHEREALLALSTRRDRLATSFIRQAYNDPTLTALVLAAQRSASSLPLYAGG